jgi:hypothetical protein
VSTRMEFQLSQNLSTLSAVFLIRPKPAKKKTAPRIEYTVMALILWLLLLFAKYQAAIIKPAMPRTVRIIPKTRFSISRCLLLSRKQHAAGYRIVSCSTSLFWG